MFRGYLLWDSRYNRWKEDEWLHRICRTEGQARDILEEFAEGRPYDNSLEVRITRYFGKRSNPFIRGTELGKNDPDIEEQEWMRYCAYPVIEL